MGDGAIEALREDREALLGICDGLGPSDWSAPSGCPGWSVQDVIAHVGALYWVVVDPTTLPDVSGLPTERAQDLYVETRRSWSPDQVVGDYEEVSAKALDALVGLAALDLEVPLGDLGTYPASLLPSAFAFDHFLHIRSDLFAPRGPLKTEPPVADELRIAPALDWVEAALPQQNAEALASLGAAVEIELQGPAARRICLGHGAVSAHVRSDTSLFLRVVTQRANWEEAGVEASGDERDLSVVGALHVF